MRAVFRCGSSRSRGAAAAPSAFPTSVTVLEPAWWCGASAASACQTPRRYCASSSRDGTYGEASAASSTASRASSAHPHSSYAQFQQQRQRFHQHSFYEKGTAPPRGDGGDSANAGGRSSQSTASSSSSTSWEAGHTTREKDERVYGRGSATAQQRRQVRQHWEKSFFGRMHYEEGMHSRFAEALQAEEEEAYKQAMKTGASHAELFPDWPEDERAPRKAFLRLRPSMKLQYIVNRLSSGERRIRYAADFGGMSMMAQLNLGEFMVAEATELLRELGWMNEEVEARIEEMQQLANKIKYDYDLD